MRRAFIAFGIAVFLLYCWASVAYQNQVNIPDYRLVDVDLLGGRTRAAWNADSQGQFQRLMELETKNYQLPPDAKVAPRPSAAGGEATGHQRLDADGNLSVDAPLTSNDFARFIETAPEDGPATMRLRDTSAIYGLLGQHYLLRDNIADPADPEGEPLYVGGRHLDKAMLDDLRARGFRTITVTGHATPVNFLVGTSLMVALIFLTLVAALKPILWDPFLALLERRRRELDVGGEAERQNQLEATRFREEERRRHANLARDVQDVLLRERKKTALEAGGILREAREREKAVKLEGLREIGAATREAEEELRQRIPELAEAIAGAVTPGGGSQWNGVADDSAGQS